MNKHFEELAQAVGRLLAKRWMDKCFPPKRPPAASATKVVAPPLGRERGVRRPPRVRL
jgi:hypothetical protein